MSVLKNDVGRPSKKTKIMRMVLVLIVILIILVVGLYLGYIIKNRDKTKKDNKINTININYCNVKEISGTSIPDAEKLLVDKYIYFSAPGLYGTDESFLGNSSVSAKELDTKTKMSITLLQLGYNSYDSIDDDCYLSKSTIDNAMNDLFSDVSYDLSEFEGVDCVPIKYEFSSDKNVYLLTKVNGDCGGGMNKYIYSINNEKEENNIFTFDLKILNMDPGNIYYYDSNNSIKSISITNELYDEYINSDDEKILNKYEEYANIYEWTFVKNNDGNYVFDKVTRLK